MMCLCVINTTQFPIHSYVQIIIAVVIKTIIIINAISSLIYLQYMYLCHSSFILVIIGECRLRKSSFLSIRKKLTFSTDTRMVRTQKDISSININKAPSVDVLRSLLSIH
ncbi:hypothetical protein ACKWTF_005477 [Chironomus riparius]